MEQEQIFLFVFQDHLIQEFMLEEVEEVQIGVFQLECQEEQVVEEQVEIMQLLQQELQTQEVVAEVEDKLVHQK